MKINIKISKLESQNLSSETYDSNPEFVVHTKTAPNNKKKLELQKYCNKCHKSNHSVSICSKNKKTMKKTKPYSRPESPLKSINQCFKAYQDQILSYEQRSLYTENIHSRNSYDS